MRSKRTQQIAVCILAALAVSLCGSAAYAIPWSNASGANARFAWSGGQNIGFVESPVDGHHGNPTVDTVGFHFMSPVAYRAEQGGQVSVQDMTRVTLNVGGAVGGPAPAIDMITVREFGTWSADLGEDPADPEDFQIQVDFDVFRTSPGPPGTTWPIDLPDVTFLPDGTWSTTYTHIPGVTPLPPHVPPGVDGPWLIMQVTVRNSIAVVAGAPAGAWIEKTGMEILIPEPATVSLLMCAAPLLRRRGRSRAA